MNLYDEARKEATIHQQARTDLLNCYGKYMNKQMYAELWNYTLKVEERAKKVEELVGLYKQLGGIEQDIEYLCGLRDCMIEHSVEKPMEHIHSGIKEYKINRDDILKQIKQKEEELKNE